MKKFNIGLKKDRGERSDSSSAPSPAPSQAPSNDDSSSRSKLFGSRNKNKSSSSPAPSSSNPYAVNQPSSSGGNPYANAPQLSSNPYDQKLAVADPYTQQKLRSVSPASSSGYGSVPRNGNGYGAMRGTGEDMLRAPSIMSQPPPYDAASDEPGYRDEKSAAQPQNGNGRYGNSGQYGNQGGYGGGGDRWSETSSVATTRVGGYGGYGARNSAETLDVDAGREALFSGAKERLQQKQADTQLPPEDDPAQGYGGPSGGDSYGYRSNNYDRQLTAEEQEEEDVSATKNQIRELKKQDVSETRNALRTAAQAEETGRATLERLGLQGERIHNAERNLDLSANQNRLADERYREIKRLNRSMFAPNIANPFTKAARQAQMDAAVIEQHHKDKNRREATRANAYQSVERQNAAQRRLKEQWEKDHGRLMGGGGDASGSGGGKNAQRLAERSKYQFEADSEDEQLEDEIDGNLDALSGAAGRLNMLGRAIGAELESQNKHIEMVGGKVDSADDDLEMLRAKLARIK